MAAVAEIEPKSAERRRDAMDRVVKSTTLLDRLKLMSYGKKKVSGTIFLMNEKMGQAT